MTNASAVAVSAPAGRDAAVLSDILTSAKIGCVVVSADALLAGIAQSQFMAVVMTEEALLQISAPSLERAVAQQAVWSDLHFIVLTAPGEPRPQMTALLQMLGNASPRVRPVHPSDLVALVRLAIRARKRQFEAGRHLEEKIRSEEKLLQLTVTLEEQIAERTAALAANADQLRAEVRERAEAQDRINRMQAELIHVARLSAMGTMASTIAHELNQPLGAVANYVSGSIHMLRADRGTIGSPILDAMESANENALRAGEIVRRLRELVSRGEVTRREESLSNIIEEALVIAMVDADLLEVSCTLALDPSADTVVVDKVQVQQVLINLIRNAVEAMRSVSFRAVALSSKRLTPEMVEVSVSDTGPGLTANALATLFSPFVTTKSEGMGLGLSISRTIIESHNGSIKGANGDLGGAVFRFTLPTPDR